MIHALLLQRRLMKSFTLPQLQRVCDIYARYIRIRKVNIKIGKFRSSGLAYATPNPRKIFIVPKVLTLSRRAQLCLLIHEMCHHRRGGMNHAKSWKQAVSLWGSLFQMRYVHSDEEVKQHIIEGCTS